MEIKVPGSEYWAERPSGTTMLTQVPPLPAMPTQPKVDWTKWLNMPRVALWEAVALSLNTEPDQVTATGQAFDSRMHLALAHLADGLLLNVEANDVQRVAFTRVSLADIARLAESCKWQVPAEFPQAEALREPVTAKTQDAAELSTVSSTELVLARPQRFQGYGKPLYDLLKAASIAGKPCPKARDVLDCWKIKLPPDVFEVMADGLKYYDTKGNIKIADLEAIRKSIARMVS